MINVDLLNQVLRVGFNFSDLLYSTNTFLSPSLSLSPFSFFPSIISLVPFKAVGGQEVAAKGLEGHQLHPQREAHLSGEWRACELGRIMVFGIQCMHLEQREAMCIKLLTLSGVPGSVFGNYILTRKHTIEN